MRIIGWEWASAPCNVYERKKEVSTQMRVFVTHTWQNRNVLLKILIYDIETLALDLQIAAA